MHKSISFIMQLLLVIFVAGQIQAIERYHQGLATIYASPSIVTMPASVWGIVLDTSECVQCRDTIPSYQFLGDILVDSIIYVDSTRSVDSAEQIQGISIESSELQSVIQQVHAFRLTRVFRGVIPGDTLNWNPVTQKMDTLPDLSWVYRLSFDPNITVDSVIDLLSTVSGLIDYGGKPIIHWDAIDDRWPIRK